MRTSRLIPELNKLANDWKWLIQLDQFTLFAVSPFGDLFMKDITGAFCLLDINLGALEYAELDGSDPALLFPIAFDDRIAAGYREASLHLTEGKCYGYKKQCVAGGSVEIENVYVANTAEYVSFMGDFHYQIRDVEDGESVFLKVIQ